MIILPVLQDPTDIVIQGEQIIPAYTGPIQTTQALISMLQGWISTAEIPIQPIPSLMIGQSDWYGILPRTIGPMVMLSDGTLTMLTIGATPINMIIDPIQSWINSKMVLDFNGSFQDLNGDLLLGAVEPDFYETTFEMVASIDQNAIFYPFSTSLPRNEIKNSGIIKNLTAPILPKSFGQHMMEYYTETSQKYMITGVTRDGAGNPLGGCRVVVFQTNKITSNTDQYSNPYEGETVSDGGGNYSIQMDSNEIFQIIAYLPGSPDVAGITINTITPIVG